MSKVLDSEGSGINQLVGIADDTPYKLWVKACGNNWLPTEINMADDVNLWKSKDGLSEDERLLVKRVIGFFSGGESLVGNNLILSAYKYITDGGCRQYLLRQAFEESVHNGTVKVCCESYNLDQREVAQAYQNQPATKAKDDFLLAHTTNINRQDFDINTLEGKQELFKNLFAFYIICEGIFFYSGFAMILALGRQNKLTGFCDQVRYTLRDETLHIEFGVYLLNRIKREYPEIWTTAFVDELIEMLKKAVGLEINYSADALPNGILGLNAPMFIDYMQYIGNRRTDSLEIPFQFPSNKNPFPWLGEVVDQQPMAAFFERKERAYKQAGLVVDNL